jgi:hypothetical protein
LFQECDHFAVEHIGRFAHGEVAGILDGPASAAVEARRVME